LPHSYELAYNFASEYFTIYNFKTEKRIEGQISELTYRIRNKLSNWSHITFTTDVTNASIDYLAFICNITYIYGDKKFQLKIYLSNGSYTWK